jgi:hypothetical protein
LRRGKTADRRDACRQGQHGQRGAADDRLRSKEVDARRIRRRAAASQFRHGFLLFVGRSPFFRFNFHPTLIALWRSGACRNRQR